MKILRQKMSAFLTLAALMCITLSWGQAFTLTHGFGGPDGVPTGIQIVSYDGVTACNTSPNGANAVTTLRIKAMPGYNFTVTSISGTGVRSNSGASLFTIVYVNNGNTNTGTAATIGGTSSCSGTSALNSLVVPLANQQVTENAFVDIKVQRAPGSTSGLGYSHVKSLVINGVVSLSAPPAPVATTATNITATSFTANWNNVTAATGYRLDVASDMAFTNLLEDYDNIAVSGLSKLVNIGLQPNTTYYYRVRAEIGAMVSPNSNVITLTTLNPLPATVVTTEILATGITSSTAASGGNVTDAGNDNITARGVVYATTANPTTASSATTDGTGAGVFTSSLTALSANTQYYYRAYATNSTGTSYGTEYSFWTHANTPGAPAASGEGIFSLDIALDVNGNPANTLFAIMIGTDMYVAANGGTSNVPVWQTAAQWGAAIDVNNLAPDTAYTFSVAAQNGAGVQTPWSTTAQGTTLPLAGPTTLTLINNTIDFEPACLSTDPDGAIGSITFDATNLSGTGLGVGTVVISGPDGAALEGISFSGSATGTFDEGTFQIADVLEGVDHTVYVRFDPTAGVSYGSLTFEIALVDTMNSTATPLEVEVVIVDLPTAPAVQTVCDGTTVAGLATTTGTGIKWYTAATGGTALAATEVLTAQTYYASQSIGDCESGRIPVAVTVTPLPAAPVAEAQLFCGPSTVSQLVVTTGIAPKWYTAQTGGTELAGTEALATATYYVSQTVTDCEGPRTAVAVTVNPIPVAPTAVTQAFCGPTTVAALMVTTGADVKWYAAETGGAELDEAAAIATGTYYASQTVDGCESPRTSVAVTVNPIPAAPVVDNVQTFCTEATIADLDATGTGILWYTAPTGGTALEETTAIAVGTSLYYASQTVDGCESTVRSAVAVQLNNTPAPAAADQEFCGAATVSQLATGGIAPQWYTEATGGNALEGTATLATGTYYVSQTISGCESFVRTAVEVTVNTIPAAPAAVAQSFCGSGIVSQLMVTTGENIQWYAAETGGAALAGNATLATGNYYASQTVNGCESTRTPVAVTVNTVPATPEIFEVTFCNAATVSELIAMGGDLTWYEAATGGEAIQGTVAVETGLYYVTQTVDDCESVRTAVQVTVNVTEAPTAEAQSFCNAATVADLEVTAGTAVKWYASETGGTELADTEELATGTYYVSQTLNNCEGSRASVVITVIEVETVTGEATQEFEAGETLADLEAEGENIVWYADADLTDELPETTELVDGTIYYAVATQGECSSTEALEITVVEVLGTGGFDKANLTFFPNPVNDVLNLSYSDAISSVVVYNLLGQSVLSAEPNVTSAQVDMSSLAAGNYIVKVAAGDTSATIKVIKR